MSENATRTSEEKPVIERIRRWYRGLPDKKRYLEFVTALLTIPVLLTVLLGNLSNIQKQKTADTTPTPSVTTTVAVTHTPSPRLQNTEGTQSPTPTTVAACIREVGPMEILYPEENVTISENPVCLELSKQKPQYCAVVWSYRINGSSWSAYTDRAICMYGLDAGRKTLDLRIKSIASGDEVILKRTFTVLGDPTPTQATSSATVQ